MVVDRQLCQTVIGLIALITTAGTAIFILSLNINSNEADLSDQGAFREQRNTSENYNFVVILADDLGWADVSWNNANVKVIDERFEFTSQKF